MASKDVLFAIDGGMMADVFISFIHEEQKVAAAVQALLKAALTSKQVFLSSDQWQVHAGEIWLDRIKQELSSAKVVILMLSPRSVERPWVNFEAGASWLAGKPIIPSCFGKLSKGQLPKPYSSIQALDLPSEAYYLVTSVAHHLHMIPPPPLWGRHDKELQELDEAIAETAV